MGESLRLRRGMELSLRLRGATIARAPLALGRAVQLDRN
jgi:hypothetical protein